MRSISSHLWCRYAVTIALRSAKQLRRNKNHLQALPEGILPRACARGHGKVAKPARCRHAVGRPRFECVEKNEKTESAKIVETIPVPIVGCPPTHRRPQCARHRAAARARLHDRGQDQRGGGRRRPTTRYARAPSRSLVRVDELHEVFYAPTHTHSRTLFSVAF
jgi:hypothetical protein